MIDLLLARHRRSMYFYLCLFGNTGKNNTVLYLSIFSLSLSALWFGCCQEETIVCVLHSARASVDRFTVGIDTVDRVCTKDL
jgi:hypothetical protein